MKDEATRLFKSGSIDSAIQKFRECLNIDPLNLSYNAIIHLNIAIGLSKKGKNEDALSELNKATEMNPNYAKAYVKRGELNQTLENYDEAVRDF